MLPIIVAMLAGLSVLLVILGIQVCFRPSDRRLDQQLSRLEPERPGVSSQQPGMRQRLASVIAKWRFSESLAARLGRAGVKLTVTEFLIIKLSAALVVFGLFQILTRVVLISLPLGVVSFFVPDLWLRRKEQSRFVQFGQQLPDTIRLMTSNVRAGFSLQQALFSVAKQAPDPTGSEFSRLTQEIRLGTPVLEALENLAQRIKSSDMELLVSIFSIQSRVGGNLADIMETMAETMRERVRLKREVEVITAMQRSSGYVLGLLPVVIAAVLFLINPAYMMGMFQVSIYLFIPIGAGVMTLLGFLVIQKLVDIEV